jgi:16S rRNA (cytosine967-C5)-methyltransferase
MRIDRALAAHAELKRTPPRVVTALRIAAYQLLFLDRVPSYAAVDDAVHAARAAAGPKLAGFCNAVLRKVSASGEPALPAPGRDRIEVEYSLPRWIAGELAAAIATHPSVGGERATVTAEERLEQVAAALARPAPIVARANRLRTTREELLERLRAEGVTALPVTGAQIAAEVEGETAAEVGADMALALEGLGDPARSATFNAGLWTVQDAGAQIVGTMASPRAGQRILDACAGVGGKSTHLAELSDDTAQIDAADQLKTKLHLAEETARRLGITSMKACVCDLLDPAAPLASAYDLIVLDAPCSGLGVLRRHPDAKWRLKPDDVPRLAALQRQLLDAVVPRLAPSGTLIYSVCTFTLAEGPAQVSALVERTGLRVLEERRTWPPAADAFYIARLAR